MISITSESESKVKGSCPCVSPPQPSEHPLLGQIDAPLPLVSPDDHHGPLLADLHVLVHELKALLHDLSGQQAPLHALVLEKLAAHTVLVRLIDLGL